MRWVMRFVFGLLALVAVVVVALLLLPAERIATLAEDRFHTATGRTITLSGDVRPTIWPSLGVTTGAVSVANAPWSDSGPMLRAESVQVSVDLAALFGGDVRITAITAIAPEILLEIGPEGQANWQLAQNGSAGGTETPDAPAALPDFTLDSAELRRGSLRFFDRRSGADHRLSALDATLSIPSMQGQTAFDVSALINGQAARVKGTIDGLSAFVARGVVPVVADVEAGRADLRFSGRAGLTPLAAAGRLTGDLGNLSDVMAVLGGDVPELPRGLGRDKVALLGDITFTDGTLNLRDATLTLDDNSFAAAADIVTGGDRVTVNARLSTGALDLSALATGNGGGGGGGGADGWGRSPIDVSGLQALDGQLALEAQSIRLGDIALGTTNLFSTLERGRAVTDIRRIAAFGGELNGNVVLNSRGGFSTRVALNGSGIDLSQVFGALAGFDRLAARGDLSLNMLGVGNDMAALMNSWNGEGRFSTGAGEVLGLDLVGMLRTMDANFMGEGSKTIFDRIGASFTVTDGVLRNDDFALVAPLLVAGGAGQIGIGARTLDYRLEPRLLGENGVAVPVLISGSWAAPRIRLDLESIARDALREDARALEDQAKEAARAKLEQELGVPITDGRSAEEAIKQRLEEEAKKGLLNLLGGN